MTNREWLESCPDEKMAKIISEIACEEYCVFYNNDCEARCVMGVTAWLQQEHKEPKKEFTAAQLYEVFKVSFQNRRVISLEEVEKLINDVFEDE